MEVRTQGRAEDCAPAVQPSATAATAQATAMAQAMVYFATLVGAKGPDPMVANRLATGGRDWAQNVPPGAGSRTPKYGPDPANGGPIRCKNAFRKNPRGQLLLEPIIQTGG